MALPRSTSTRRAVLSYDQYSELYKQASPPIMLPDLLVKDYQGIFQDFVFTSDEIDILDVRVTANEADIVLIKEDIVDLQLRVAALEYRAYENVSTTVSLTTSEFQIILCKNTLPIDVTLKTDPMDGDEVSVIRTNATVRVVGTINNKTNLILNVKGSGPKFVYDAVGLTWWRI
jgi:hypothetical protein